MSQFTVAPAAASILVGLSLIAAIWAAGNALVDPLTALVVAHFGG
jgi:hypothetical protein